jgi:hypothetical protein
LGLARVSGPNFANKGANLVERHQARRGMRVQVRENYRKAELRGAAGTVQQIWSNPTFATAMLVRLDDERYELFWNHDLQLA